MRVQEGAIRLVGDAKTHIAPVLGGGRFTQPGADGGEWRYALRFTRDLNGAADQSGAAAAPLRFRRAAASSLGRLAVVVLVAFLARHDRLGDQTGILPHRGFDLGGDVGIVLEELLGVLAALADAL